MALKKVAVNGSIAGGAIVSSATKTRANSNLIALHGDSVAPHGAGLHAAAVVIASTTKVFVEGKAVVRDGDLATCGDTVSGATCSPNVFAGD